MTQLPKSSKGLGIRGKGDEALYADPRSFSEKTPVSEMPATWEKLRLDMTGSLASFWFGLDESKDPTLNIQMSELGSPVEFSRSTLAKDVLTYIDGKVSASYRHGLVQIASNLFINANDLSGEPQTSFIDGGDADQTWFAPWGTSFGSRIFVNMKTYADSQGVETVAFFIQGLIASRSAEVGDDGELADFENEMRSGRIPELAKRLLYLSETPFPSSIMNFSRKIVFPDVEETFWPTPFYSIDDFQLALCPFEDVRGSAAFNAHIFPQVVSFGWCMKKLEPSFIEPVVSTVIDSLVRAASLLEDGFRNFSEPGVPFGWHNIFGGPQDPAWDEYEPQVRSWIPRWVPISHMGSLAAKTAETYAAAQPTRNESGLTWVAQFGVGENVSDAINTLAFSVLKPAGRYQEAIGYLEAAIALDHYNQSTNALSNLGQVYMAIGDLETAETVFLKALARPDKFSEGEASLELGKLYEKKGMIPEAKQYFNRAEASGSSPYAEEAKKLLANLTELVFEDSPTEFEIPTKSPFLKFCTSCGSKRLNQDQRFCGECGSPLE